MHRYVSYLILTALLPVSSSAGQNAIRFNAYGAYLDVASSPSLETAEFTVELWLRVDELGNPNVAGGEQNLLDKRGEHGEGYNIRLAGTQWPIHAFGLVGADAGVGADASIVQSQWTHLAVTQDADSLRFYVNTILTGADSSRYEPVSTSLLRIGDFLGFPWAYLGLRGDIDELRIWDHARHPDSIAANLHATLSGAEPGLAAYWPFETASEGWTPDLTANGNHAQMFGSARLVPSEAPVGFTPLSAPVALRAIGSRTAIDLAWRSRDDGASVYRIYRGDDESFIADDASLFAVVPGTDSTFVDSQVVPGFNYFYRVRAVDADGHVGHQSDVTLGRVVLDLDYLTGVYYLNSYDPADTTRDWQGAYVRELFDPPQPPMLGHYSSRDPAVITQHLDWMESYGIDFLACEWWQIDSWEDVTLRDFLLPEIGDTSVRFSLQYMINNFWGESGLVVDDGVRQQMLADFEHMADTYFGHPNFLRIDGRPVVFLAGSRHLQGDFLNTFASIRSAMQNKGFDILLVGDEFRWGVTEPEHFSFLDAVGPYVMGTWRYRGRHLGETEFAGDISRWAGRWEAAAHPYGKYAVPSVTPGVNTRQIGGSVVTPRLFNEDPGAMTTLEAQIRLMRPFVDPYLKMIMVIGWNHWFNDRQIEPATVTAPTSLDVSDSGSDYTLGFTYEGYGMRYLEIIRDLLAPELAVGFEAPPNEAPSRYALHQNYPNPFGRTTTIEFDLPRRTMVDLIVFDVLGRRVRAVVSQTLAAGRHSRTIDSSGMASGVYYYRLTTDEYSTAQRMTVLHH